MDGSEPRSLLLSIVPDSPTTHGHTFDLPGDDAMAPWIERSNKVAGVYWTVNACKPDLTKKARKADVEWLLGIWGDLDPSKGRDLARERDRLHRLAGELMALPWPPTVIIDSGGGIQPLWRLETPLEASEEFRRAKEALGRRTEAALGGVENTSNADRVLRLPFTINHPNRIKIEQGRAPVMSGILAETGLRYSWRDLEALAARLEDEPPEHAEPVEYRERRYTNGHAVHLDGLPDYPTEEQIEALLENHANLRVIWDQTTHYPPEDTSPSGWDQSFASTLAALGLRRPDHPLRGHEGLRPLPRRRLPAPGPGARLVRVLGHRVRGVPGPGRHGRLHRREQGVLLPGRGAGAVPTIQRAPADFVETANTIGLPRYAKQAVDQQFARWVMLHVQSNPLPICTRPRVLIKGKRTR